MTPGGLDFGFSEASSLQLIKVVGVGGGGGNAVNKMCVMSSVKGVSFLLCNTDAQALSMSSVPNRITIGPTITQGLGAGNRPERAREAAEESRDVIREALLAGETRMVFITAGMGGGTGTGAAPVIGRIAMEAGLLTIGIVTIPFLFEGKKKILQALEGVKQMRKSVDALLVVNNQRLIEIYPDYTVRNAFEKADDTLSNAARGISDIVNIAGSVNVDFADVNTTLRGGGVAVINTGYAEGEGRVRRAIEDALNSPLLNNNNIQQARHLLITVYSGEKAPLTVEEFQEIQDFTDGFTSELETILGIADRDDLEDKIAVTILASGFDFEENEFRQGIERDEDPLERIARANQRKSEDDLIRSTYGESVVTRPRSEPISLLIGELDDEELLLLIAETPSLERNGQLFYSKRKERAAHRPLQIGTLGGRTTSRPRPRREELEAFTSPCVATPSRPTTPATPPPPPPAPKEPSPLPGEQHEEPEVEESAAEVIHFTDF